MNKIPTYLRCIFLPFLFLLLHLPAHANHLVGMDLFYTYVSGNTYKITLIAYGDCGSAPSSPAFGALSTNAPEVYIYNGSSYVATINLAIQPPSAGVEITPVCPADIALTQCTNPSFSIPGIKKFVYSANYTVSGPSTAWRFLFTGQMTGSIAGRALSITNINTAPVTYIELVDTLNNSVTHNSSPALTNVPTPFFCLDNPDNYNPGAIDPDGDSLMFYLVSGKAGSTTSTSSGALVSYISPYTATSPLAVTSMTFDNRTGQVAFYPNALQRSLVVYNIQEYHAGAFRGTSQREMTFLVQSCTNTPPTGSFVSATNGVIDDPTHFHICLNNGTFSISMNPTEADTTNNITVTATGLPTGSTFTTTSNGTPHPHSTFSWTSTGPTPGVYTFYVTYTDNNCPLSGTQTIAYTITLVSPPLVTYSIISAANCTKKAAIQVITGGGGSPWDVTVSHPGDTIQRFTGVTTNFTDSLSPGTYTLTLYSAAAHSCYASVTVTVTAPTPVNLAPTFTNPTYCGATDGTIKLYNLVAGTVDTIKYYLDGVLQPSITRTVATDGSITLTGLRAGVYTSITATYGFCVSLPAGPITLVNPGFTMRAITYTNPIFCGICNGTITLYGLRPGQTDTINYTWGGIAQPPISHLIASDSQVVLTGLCAGTYDNFIARTAGVCVSNRLGPVTLTVPPFTMRAISSTNPTYCGMCDGRVTLYGLHPGGHDTISYTRFGIFQPPVPVVVASDSTVVISGLCDGVYDNFVAHAGSTCVSNSLGPVTLTSPPFTMRSITFTNPDYCGICNGTITLHGLHPGNLDTVTYTYGGVPQPPVIRLIGADSQVVITGLCAGTYANFIAHTGGICISNTLGPVTLTVPPFTMRALSHTNPDYCGICNGTITLYGLHPGNLDTITYTLGGVPQPRVIRLIGADSQVVITGLCGGVYHNFIARTGGICVSNTLGPVTLTVPPFTIRALSHTNPDYCGICNGTITVYGAHPGQLDTLTYTYGGTPQPPVILTVPADSQIHISGLCAGTYDNFVVRTAGVCVSNTLGPVTLTVPAFTMRTDTFKNPTKCGFCNGVIWLFGLHPGQTDTIYYDFNGVPQTPVSYLIPPDSIVILSGLCEGVYSNIIARTAGTCVSNALGPTTLKAPPIIPGFTYTLGYGCGGDTLRCTNTSWPASDLTYVWSFGDGGTSTLTNPTYVYHSPGTFTIKLVITNTKCIDSTTHTITLNNLINAGFTSIPDSFVCQHSPVAFTNTSLGTQLRYKWTFGDGGTDTLLNTNHTYPNVGNYRVVLHVTNFVPCFDSAVHIMAVDSISAISASVTDSVICNSTGVTLTGIFASTGLENMTWTFGNGDSIRNINPLFHVFDREGYYKVMVKAYYRACPDTFASTNVRVFNHPPVYIGEDTSICPGSNPILIGDYLNTASSGARWKWSTGETSPQIKVVEPGRYYVTVNVHGCEGSDTIWVKNDCYLDVPNAFSPNGDGLNDYFLPRPLLGKGLTEFSMEIFNRWGQLIFSTNNVDGRGWDGRFNDVAQPEGVFIYVISAAFKDGQKEHRKGNVTLIR